MKPVKGWAVVDKKGRLVRHTLGSWGGLNLWLQSVSRMHGSAYSDCRIVRVEIRAIEKKRNVTPVGGKSKASRKNKRAGDSQ